MKKEFIIGLAVSFVSVAFAHGDDSPECSKQISSMREVSKKNVQTAKDLLEIDSVSGYGGTIQRAAVLEAAVQLSGSARRLNAAAEALTEHCEE